MTYPSIFALGQRVHELRAKFEELDEREQPEISAEVVALDAFMLRLELERGAVQDLILSRVATSLQDAAVQAAQGFYEAERMRVCDVRPENIKKQLGRLEFVFASIATAIARAASIDLATIGQPSLPDDLAKLIPTMEMPA